MTLDAKANKLIRPLALPGKVMQGLTGSGEQLVEQGRISSHHRIAGYEGVEIDTWVINSRMVGRVGEDSEIRKITRGTAVLLHPLMASKSWFLVLGGKLADMGWDIVLPDLRAHGRSGGQYITWGAKEKHDIKIVVDRLVADRVVCDRVFIIGASLGGAVGIQYAVIEPRCRGVMALAPPRSARGIGRRILLMAGPKTFEAAIRRAGELADFDPEEASSELAAGQLRCPLLLVHGIWDFVVPYQHSRAILRAAGGPKRLQPMYLRGHAVEFCNDAEMLKQFAVLEQMSQAQDGEHSGTKG